ASEFFAGADSDSSLVIFMTLRPWKTLGSRLLLERRWLRLHEDRVETGRGAIIDEFHVLESPSWVATICITSTRELVLVEQYRHGYGGFSLELPAGVMEPGEEIAAAGARELLEETGYQGDSPQHFWSTRAEPARGRSEAHFVLVQNATQESDLNLDATEDLRVVLLPLKQLDEIIDRMVHGVHVGALLLAQRRGLF
ncbi:MAG: NUDIX hydrolase, partial [Polyangiaceae bacterium]|nr:NUDIX hydrolase [Polyangiaceae bacterium]